MLQICESILFNSRIIPYSALVIIVILTIRAPVMIAILRPLMSMTEVQITPVCKVYEFLPVLAMQILSMRSLIIIVSEVPAASIPAVLIIQSIRSS